MQVNHDRNSAAVVLAPASRLPGVRCERALVGDTHAFRGRVDRRSRGLPSVSAANASGRTRCGADRSAFRASAPRRALASNSVEQADDQFIHARRDFFVALRQTFSKRSTASSARRSS
jgi:hypothetical protein